MSSHSDKTNRAEKVYWLDQPRNIDRLVHGLVVICALLVIADIFYHKHTHFAFEGWFGFFAWFGFVGCVGLVLLAKGMRRVVKRDEDYYG